MPPGGCQAAWAPTPSAAKLVAEATKLVGHFSVYRLLERCPNGRSTPPHQDENQKGGTEADADKRAEPDAEAGTAFWWFSQDAVAVARNKSVQHLLVRVACLNPGANDTAHVLRQTGVRLGDCLALAHRALKLQPDAANSILGRIRPNHRGRQEQQQRDDDEAGEHAMRLLRPIRVAKARVPFSTPAADQPIATPRCPAGAARRPPRSSSRVGSRTR